MKIAFRVDASHKMGTGHVRRMKSLAQAALQNGHECLFLCRDLGIDYNVFLGDVSLNVHLLSPAKSKDCQSHDIPSHAAWAGISWQQDAAQTVKALAEIRPDWLVIDHYAFDARWHRQVRSATGALICAVDDMADRDLDCSVLIDHNYSENHRKKYALRISNNTKILGGPDHALLAPAYADSPRYQFRRVVRRIGVFVGGTDNDDVTSAVLDAIRVAGYTGDVEAALTSASPHADKLRKLAEKKNGLTLSLDLPDLARFYARHDLQIGGGGGATWERCCIGVPTLGIVIADNQKPVLLPLVELGALELIDWRSGKEQLPKRISVLLNDASQRKTLARKASQLVDGQGAQRVITSLENYE